VVFNPKDTNTFASASLDRTVKARPGWLRAPRVFAARARQPNELERQLGARFSDGLH